jgi:hypothetical protein
VSARLISITPHSNLYHRNVSKKFRQASADRQT